MITSSPSRLGRFGLVLEDESGRQCFFTARGRRSISKNYNVILGDEDILYPKLLKRYTSKRRESRCISTQISENGRPSSLNDWRGLRRP